MTIGRIAGIIKARTMAPKMPPRAEAVSQIPIARPLLPACVIGNPSKRVAAFGLVPGIFSITAVIDPP